MATLGEMLFEERKRQGISLTEVSKATKIRLSLLEAIENDNHDAMPDPGYTRGFISSYARFLHVSAQPFLDQYARDIGLPRRNKIELVQADEVVSRSRSMHEIPLRAVVLIAGIIILIGLITWGIISIVTGPDDKVLPTPPAVTVDAQKPQDSNQGSASTLIPFSLEVGVEDGKAAEVVVSVDGAVAYDGALTPDSPKTYAVNETVTITTADPTALVVKRDGETVKLSKKKTILEALDSKK